MKAYTTPGIKKLLPLLTLLLPLQTFGQSMYIYPAAPVAPRGSYQTVTAIVNGVNDKTVTWTTSGGTLVGTNPCVVNEPCVIALYTTTAGTYTLTATSNANPSVTATSTVTFTGSPTPVTSHPRLIVTAAMLPGLRAKALSTNPMYEGFLNWVNTNYYTPDTSIWTFSTWNGSACMGGSGPSSDQSNSWRENDANYFAWLSMVAPTSALRNQYGCAARDIWVYVMTEVLNGATSMPQNHWSDSSTAFALTTDWLMGGGYLSSADQTQARAFLAHMTQLVAPYGSTPSPTEAYDSSAMFNAGSTGDLATMRGFGNNYIMSKDLYMVAASLTFNDDATDDPPLTNTCSATRYQVCPDFSAGSLHAYWNYFDGALLYDTWAHLEDPIVSWQAYQAAYGNLPTQPSCEYKDATSHPCFGDGRGGESSEGSWYSYSIFRLRYALNIAYTAGYDDPILYGPQISLGTSSWWDMKYMTDLSFLTGFSAANGASGGSTIQPAFNYFTTGDSLNYYRTINDFSTEASMMTFDTYTGRTDRGKSLEWSVLNSAFGMADGTADGCNTSGCGFDRDIGNFGYSGTSVYDTFIALPATDPISSLPTDPRPSFPTDLYNGSFSQHLMVRSNWTQGSNTILSYYCPNTLIDHEGQFCGRFDVYANNEYITKGRVTFNDYNGVMETATQSNEVSIANTTGTGCNSVAACNIWYYQIINGGQLSEQEEAGFDTMLHSELPAYASTVVNNTGSYNGWWTGAWDYKDVTASSRSLVYLRGTSQIIYYDRATTGTAAAKGVYLTTTGTPTITGDAASWPTRSGTQKAYYTALLPSGGTITNVGLSTVNVSSMQANDWEPSSIISNTPATNSASTQFLSVLEWGASSLTRSTTTLVESTGGQTFDGAMVGSSLVMFMRNWPATFTSVTYPASGATTQYVSDLTPNTSYTISGAGTPASATTDTAGVLTFAAAGTGSITVGGSSAPTVVTVSVTPATLVLQALAFQQYVATCTYSDGSSADCTPESTWSSSASGVVSIDSSGMATGVAQGSANIIATSGSVQGQASVTVPAATLQSIEVTPGPLAVPVGGTQQFQATGIYSNLTRVDMTSLVRWSSSNAAVVSPNSAGLASMMSRGSANIIATIGNVQGQVAVTVSAPATPSFSPAAGTYASAQTVTIATTTPSATIYYTTNGSTPTTSSAVYSGPITVSSTETIHAIAVASGSSMSASVSAAYTIDPTQAVTPSFSPAAGTYASAQTVTIATTTPSTTIYYTTNGSTPTTSSAVYSGPISVSSTETIHAIAVASGSSTSATGSAAYTINPTQAATPSFSPAAGTYASAQTVTIATTTPSATIYYTTNGSTPTTSSAVYSGPISVSSTETIHAIAVASGSSTSATGSAAYTINPTQSATPSFSVDLLPALVSVTAGQSGTTTVLVTPTSGFASAITFSCSGLPAGASCKFSPATLVPSSGAASTTLTVTTAPTTAALSRGHSPLLPSSVLAIAFCCLGWKKRRGLYLLLLAGVAVGLSLCTGCGSSDVIPISATTSTVSVIATSGPLQPTTSFTLQVR